MRKEIMKQICFPTALLMFLLIPTIINAQSKDSSSGAIDDLFEKWSSTWSRQNPKNPGEDFLMGIKQIHQDKKTVKIAYSWSGVRGGKPGKSKATATLIPPDKLEWFTKSGTDYRFELKEGELWGTKRTRSGETQKIVLKKLKE